MTFPLLPLFPSPHVRAVASLLAALVLLLSTSAAWANDKQPDVIGVMFYADWCPSCKVLEPNIRQARAQAELDQQSVLFVRLDFTDAARRHQAGLLAEALGIDEVFAKYQGKTGFMLLLDGHTKALLSRLDRRMDANALAAAVSRALEQSAAETG